MYQQFMHVSHWVERLWRTAGGNLADLFSDVFRALQDAAPHHQVIIGLTRVVLSYVCLLAFSSRARL